MRPFGELRSEVKRERPPGHALHAVQDEPVAIRAFLKELVCWVPDQQTWAWVHLTWTVETDPRWPATQIISEWADPVNVLRRAQCAVLVISGGEDPSQ
jgi:hypothetical protein